MLIYSNCDTCKFWLVEIILKSLLSHSIHSSNNVFCSFSPPWRAALSMFNNSLIMFTEITKRTCHELNSSGIHLEFGVTRVFCPTWILSTRTCPSWPGNTSSTLPRGHCALEKSGEIERTTSPTLRSRWVSVHFWHVLSDGSHSFNHLFQKCEISSWTHLHLFLGLKPISSTDSGAERPPTCPWKKWLGVSGVVS